MTHTLLFAGGYSPPSVAGIHVFDVSLPDEPSPEIGAISGIENPSFLAVHPNRSVLYAVSETTQFNGRRGGGLAAFHVDPTGSFRPLGAISSHGDGPCHVAVHPAGSHVFVANYLSGSVAVHSLHDDGSLGALVAHHQHGGSGPTTRQEGPHAHCVRPAPDGGSVYAVDLGADEVIRYDHIDRPEGETFVAGDHTSVAAGAGPRHIAFHPWHPLAVLVNELDNTVTSFEHAEDGGLVPVATRSTLPPDADNCLAADIQFHPAGHRCYVSNRGHDSVAVFDCEDPSRPLGLLGHVGSGGRTPRSLALHPSGRAMYVANQDSNRIASFAVDPASGFPERVARELEMPSPTCVITMELPS
jgi:6-phosphogluconolactonase